MILRKYENIISVTEKFNNIFRLSYNHPDDIFFIINSNIIYILEILNYDIARPNIYFNQYTPLNELYYYISMIDKYLINLIVKKIE